MESTTVFEYTTTTLYPPLSPEEEKICRTAKQYKTAVFRAKCLYFGYFRKHSFNPLKKDEIVRCQKVNKLERAVWISKCLYWGYTEGPFTNQKLCKGLDWNYQRHNRRYCLVYGYTFPPLTKLEQYHCRLRALSKNTQLQRCLVYNFTKRHDSKFIRSYWTS